MTQFTIRRSRGAGRRFVAALTTAVVAAAGVVAVTAAPAQAAARLTATSSLGGATASSTGPTTFTVSGSGYQAIEGGFGGVYVGFGWVNGSGWGPSNGGSTGRTYDYVPDEQTKSNKGYQAFVAFPGSETSVEAQSTMSSDGSFRIQLTVPGPTFTGAGGKKIDCLKVTCGFFTWGAHGVRRGANETFTPVTFQAAAAPAAGEGAAPVGDAPAATGADSRRAASGRAAGTGRAAVAAAAPTAQDAPAETDTTNGEPAPDGQEGEAPVDRTGGVTVTTMAVIEVDRRAARPGGAMGFAAAGFWPSEQVYVVLGDGTAAVGPLQSGIDGEVAGVIVLPQDMDAGTQEIRAVGAGSGLEAVEKFAVRADIAPAAASTGLYASLKWVFLAMAALAVLAAAAFAIWRRQRTGAAGLPGESSEDDGDLLAGGAPADPQDPYPAFAGDQREPEPALHGGYGHSASDDQPTVTFEKKDIR